MKRFLIYISSLLLLLPVMQNRAQAQLIPTLGAQRVGTSSAQFLKIGVGARAEALGQAFIAVANDATALYWNPAGLTRFEGNQAYFNHTEWVVDLKIENAGIVYHLDPLNSIGFSLTFLHTEDMMETTVFSPLGTGRTFTYADALFGVSYARQMTDQFSFGVTLKYFKETIAEVSLSSVLFDLGTFYETGFANTRFAVSLSNFGTDISPDGSFEQKDLNNVSRTINSFQSFAPPTMFRFGVANDFNINENNRLTTSIQLNHPNDNSENINIGFEYSWQEFIALRAGYKTAQVEEDFSAGFGLRQSVGPVVLRADYAFTNFGRLGTVNRFDLMMEF